MNCGMIISYDGSRYEGWQRQTRTKETIQGKLEEALFAVTGEKAQIIGAGRTDAGVHAMGQYANIHLSKACDLKGLEDKWNRALPDDISSIIWKRRSNGSTAVSPRRKNITATASA